MTKQFTYTGEEITYRPTSSFKFTITSDTELNVVELKRIFGICLDNDLAPMADCEPREPVPAGIKYQITDKIDNQTAYRQKQDFVVFDSSNVLVGSL